MSASELGKAVRRQRGALAGVAVFSAAMNLLMLTGPLFMLQVHDRVLASRSEATLLVLTGLAVFLFTVMALLDAVRSRVLSRIGARFQADLDGPLFSAVLRRDAGSRPGDGPAEPLRDLAAIRAVLGTPTAGTVVDLPWSPVFAAVLFLFHPWLGWFALVAGSLLLVLALAGQLGAARPLAEATRLAVQAEAAAGHARRSAEAVLGLGMAAAVRANWADLRQAGLAAAVAASDTAGGFAAVARALRLLVQSAVLGLGAWLVLRGEITAGAMVAGSILAGRALAPVEQAVALWPQLQRAAAAWRRLDAFLETAPAPPARMPLPRPSARLEVRDLAVSPPGGGGPVLRGITFTVAAGDALAVIGPSAAGKSALARALVGLWPAVRGEIRLGGVPLDRLDAETRGRLLGYLPQDVGLLPGTVAQTIARFDPAADAAGIVAAAEAAGAHHTVLSLTEGYDTWLDDAGTGLSGGQRQRVALARALYGDPVALVLDEPNASLDDAGVQALNRAIAGARAAGRLVVVMSHRPSALAACNLVLFLDRGRMRAFGPRDEVLARVLLPAPAGRPARRAAGARA